MGKESRSRITGAVRAHVTSPMYHNTPLVVKLEDLFDRLDLDNDVMFQPDPEFGIDSELSPRLPLTRTISR